MKWIKGGPLEGVMRRVFACVYRPYSRLYDRLHSLYGRVQYRLSCRVALNVPLLAKRPAVYGLPTGTDQYICFMRGRAT